MYFGRVVGSLWCTVKHPDLVGQRLLVVQPLSPELEARGKRLICTDCTGAGTGELVYWVRGKEASFPFSEEPPFFLLGAQFLERYEVDVMLGSASGGQMLIRGV